MGIVYLVSDSGIGVVRTITHKPNFCCSCLIGPTNRKTVCQASCIRQSVRVTHLVISEPSIGIC